MGEHDWVLIMIDLYNLSPSEFEQLCFDYISIAYKNIDYSLFHTRYSHDGGKDIVVKFNDSIHSYKIWAECKQHKDNIGLEEIGKNIVLVLSRHINKVILFSASKIRDTAKTEIMTVSRYHNFDVEFLDNEILIDKICSYPNLIKRYFPNVDSTQNINKNEDFDISATVSEFFDELSNSYSDTTCFLKYGNLFYINIYIKNHTSQNIENINFNFLNSLTDMQKNDYNGFSIINSDWDIGEQNISSHSDNLFSCLCEAHNYFSTIKLPILNISFEDSNGNTHSYDLILPDIDMSKYLIYKFRGKAYIEFIANDIDYAINDCLHGIPQIIDIRGKSGMGKTRLLDEIEKEGIKKGLNIYRYDCYNYNDSDLFKKFIYDLLHIPTSKRTFEFDKEEFVNYAKESDIGIKGIEVLTNFLFRNNTQYIENLSEVLYNVIISQKKSRSMVIIDNIQELTPIYANYLQKIIAMIMLQKNNIAIVLATNTESLRYCENSLWRYLSDIQQRNKHQVHYFDCKGFSNEDKILFWMEAFNRQIPDDKLVQELSSRVGNRPIELTTACNYLKRNNIIKSDSALQWYIADNEKLTYFFENACDEYNHILQKSLNALLYEENSRKRIIQEIISAVVSFRNKMPSFFISYADIDADAVRLLCDMMILVPDKDGNYVFFHNLIYKYCQLNVNFNSGLLDKKIISYLTENNMLDKDYLLYFIYIRQNNVFKAKEHGEKFIDYALKNHLLNAAIEVGESIFKNDLIKTIDLTCYLNCVTKYCQCLSLSGNKELSCNVFYSLTDFVLVNQNKLDNDRVCSFYRDSINAHLQCFYFNKAKEILCSYKQVTNKSAMQEFLVANREGVINLSLENFSKALTNFNDSLNIAKTLPNPNFWTSITHSDVALLYFYSMPSSENRTLCINEFQKAIDEYYKCFDDTQYRKREILWHSAFINLLQNNFHDAKRNLILALNTEYPEIYSLYRLNNLYAYAEMGSGDLNKAEEYLSKVKSICEIHQYNSGFIRACNNLALCNILKNNIEDAKGYFMLSGKMINDNNMSLKLYPILTNRLKFALRYTHNSAEVASIRKTINHTKSARLVNYCNLINDDFSGFTLFGFSGFDFIF